MESELSGIFRVKLVTKNIVRGSPGTQFMHMRVNNELELIQYKEITFIMKKRTVLLIIHYLFRLLNSLPV